MNLLKKVFDDYFNIWLYAYAGNHKEKSFIRFVELKKRNKTRYIKVFSYYKKTGRVEFLKISNLNHLSYIDIIEDMDKGTEEELNALFAKTLLTQRDEFAKEAF